MCHVPGAPPGRKDWKLLPSRVAQAPAAPATATPRSLDNRAQAVVPPLSTRALAATPRRRCAAPLDGIEQRPSVYVPEPPGHRVLTLGALRGQGNLALPRVSVRRCRPPLATLGGGVIDAPGSTALPAAFFALDPQGLIRWCRT